MAERRGWCRVEAYTARPFRSRCNCPLFTSRLVRRGGLWVLLCFAAKPDFLASSDRRRPVLIGRDLSYLVEPAFSKRDLACFRAFCRRLSFRGGP